MPHYTCLKNISHIIIIRCMITDEGIFGSATMAPMEPGILGNPQKNAKCAEEGVILMCMVDPGGGARGPPLNVDRRCVLSYAIK